MATRVNLSHFLLAQLKWPTPKTRHRERSLTYYLRYKSCYGQFCVWICHFRYCVNKGWSSKR